MSVAFEGVAVAVGTMPVVGSRGCCCFLGMALRQQGADPNHPFARCR